MSIVSTSNSHNYYKLEEGLTNRQKMPLSDETITEILDYIPSEEKLSFNYHCLRGTVKSLFEAAKYSHSIVSDEIRCKALLPIVKNLVTIVEVSTSNFLKVEELARSALIECYHCELIESIIVDLVKNYTQHPNFSNLAKADSLVCSIAKEEFKVRALRPLVKVLEPIALNFKNDFSVLQDICCNLRSSLCKYLILKNIIQYSYENDFVTFKKVVLLIDDGKYRYQALIPFINTFLDKKEVAKAKELACFLGEDPYRYRALIPIIQAYVKTNETRYLEKGGWLACSIRDNECRYHALFPIIKALINKGVQSGQISYLKNTGYLACSIDNDKYKQLALIPVIEALVRKNEISVAEQFANLIVASQYKCMAFEIIDYYKCNLLKPVIQKFIKCNSLDSFELIEKNVTSMENDQYKFEALEPILKAFFNADAINTENKYIKSIEKLISLIQNPVYKDKAIAIQTDFYRYYSYERVITYCLHEFIQNGDAECLETATTMANSFNAIEYRNLLLQLITNLSSSQASSLKNSK